MMGSAPPPSELALMHGPTPPTVRPRWQSWAVVIFLVLLTAALYWPVTGHGFVTYDDGDYVTANRHIQAGVSWPALVWAFGHLHGEKTYWHPLTWVSHMVDCQMFGLKPMGHHLVNLAFHALNAALVFLVFRCMTGAFWRSAALAGLFAVHPLQVDTVAWVAERKNLLGALFWLLATWAYVRYAETGERAEHPTSNIQHPTSNDCAHAPRYTLHARRFYLLALLFFALGLMCKPVLVTLPFVLLLLDYWPLARWRSLESKVSSLESTQHATRNTQRATRLLLLDKLPFLFLSALSCLITLLGHRQMGLLVAAHKLSVQARLENAVVAYVRYLGKAVWPSHLSVFYPIPDAWPAWAVAGCGALLLAVSALAILTARRRPYLLVGWFWFLGVLVPFIGLVQAGAQAMADRFAYLPLIGLLMAIIWGAHALLCGWGLKAAIGCGVGTPRRGVRPDQNTDASARRPYPSGILGIGGATLALALVACAALTRHQLGYWQDSEALFRHALAVTQDNYIACISLGASLDAKGQTDEAIRQYQLGLRLKPDYAIAHNDLGRALARKGQTDEAMREYHEALRLNPDYADAHCNLGTALAAQGQADEAIAQFREAVRLDPYCGDAFYNLGNELARKGRVDEAIHSYESAIRVQPGDSEAHYTVGNVLAGAGRTEEAIAHFRAAILAKPEYADAHFNLAMLLARSGRTGAAIPRFREATRLRPGDADAHNYLGLALAANGSLDEAVKEYHEALRLKPDYPEAQTNLQRALSVIHPDPTQR